MNRYRTFLDTFQQVEILEMTQRICQFDSAHQLFTVHSLLFTVHYTLITKK